MSYTSPTSSTERATVEKSFKELQLDDNSKHDSAAATMESDHPPERRAAGPQTENPDSTESNSVDAAGEPSLPSGNDIGDKWDGTFLGLFSHPQQQAEPASGHMTLLLTYINYYQSAPCAFIWNRCTGTNEAQCSCTSSFVRRGQ